MVDRTKETRRITFEVLATKHKKLRAMALDEDRSLQEIFETFVDDYIGGSK